MRVLALRAPDDMYRPDMMLRGPKAVHVPTDHLCVPYVVAGQGGRRDPCRDGVPLPRGRELRSGGAFPKLCRSAHRTCPLSSPPTCFSLFTPSAGTALGLCAPRTARPVQPDKLASNSLVSADSSYLRRAWNRNGGRECRNAAQYVGGIVMVGAPDQARAYGYVYQLNEGAHAL